MIDLKREAQRLLKAKGYDLGTSGPNRDGVDGIDGRKTWEAIIAALSGPVSAGKSVIDMVTLSLLLLVAPKAPNLGQWVEPIRAACRRFEINTIRRVSAFIAQMAHESGLTLRSENLNYSAKRLAEVWPGRFAVNPKAAEKDRQPNELAKALDRKPEAIANHVYANRMGNGPPESGDGWRFRGGGPLQLTGRDNWTDFARAMAISLDEALAYGRTLEGGIMAAAWFWESNDINRLADTPGVADETRAINGGANGLSDRKAKFDALVEAMLKLERVAA